MEEKRITLRMSAEDYEFVKANADRLGISVNSYITSMAVRNCIINYDYHAIAEHTKAVAEVVSDIRHLKYLLITSSHFYPTDMTRLLDIVDELNASENQLLADTSRERNYMRSYVKEVLRDANRF